MMSEPPIPQKTGDIIKQVAYSTKEIAIPARTEKLIELECQETEDMLCEAKELSEGVYLSSGIIRPTNKKITIAVLNSTSQEYVIKGIRLPLKPLNQYHVKPLIQENESDDNVPQEVHTLRAAELGTTRKMDRLKLLHQNLDLDKTLNSEERQAIIRICEEFNDIFYLPGDKLSHTKAIKHEIKIKSDQAPINQKMYRLPEKQRSIIKEQVQEMLDSDIIVPSKSPWNSPLLVVPKKDGPQGEKRWRVVVDFRKLNKVTVGDAFPLPRIEDILDQLGHARYFTTLDLASGYHQVLVEEKDRAKTAFSTADGHFEFKRMPFGLTGAPATFQRLMNYVLTGLDALSSWVYLDDIIVVGKNLQHHQEKLRQVFNRLRINSLKLQPSKCQFLRKEVNFLGHKCSNEGVLPDTTKTECVQNFPTPKTVKQVQSFLGLANYYRKFIPNFSKIAEPLNKLIRKGVKFEWTTSCEDAFKNLKNTLIQPPLLIYPDFDKPFILTTDASGEALGAILSQKEEGQEKPIAYASRTLNKAERNYSATEKEMLAIVWAVKNFRCYLYGRKFVIYTDHKALKGEFNRKDPGSRLLRFQHKLSEYDYTIEYKTGKSNTNADALSRIPQEEKQTVTVTAQIHRSDRNKTKEENVQCQAITRAQARRHKQEEKQKGNSSFNKNTEEKDKNSNVKMDDIQIQKKPEPIYNWDDFCMQTKHKMQKIHQLVRSNLMQAKQKSKEYYDKTSTSTKFHIGDQVLVRNMNKKHKLSPIWKGPYEVIQIDSDVNCTIKIGKEHKRVHCNRLKAF